jgi:hypothetical protein
VRHRIIVCLALVLSAAQPAMALPPTPPSMTKTRTALAALHVAPTASASGYARTKFHTWDSVSGSCDTRETVLERDGTHVTTSSSCHATSGSWTSFYDGMVITSSSKVDIDHVVPLENAWVSGARAWTASRREQFANDLTDPQLIAVSASSNRAKGDRSPDEWKPRRQAAWCLYARWWIDVKTVWKLSVTQPEHDALTSMLRTC